MAGVPDPMPDRDSASEPASGEETGPLRRCLVSGESRPRQDLIRFVVGPDHTIVPDIAGKLPGHGIWVSANRASLEAAISRKLFARAARQKVEVPDTLPDQVETLVRQRLVEGIGLARRGGFALAGFEKVEQKARAGMLRALIVASDAGKDGRGKLEGLARNAYIIDCVDSQTLGGIFGAIGIVVYAGISDKAHAGRLAHLATRLKALTRDGHDTNEEAGTR